METTGIIKSILDSDLYKFTQQYFVLQNYPEAEVNYTFNNRDKSMIFSNEAVNEIKHQVNLMSFLRLTDSEYDWIKSNLYFLPVSYRQYLAAYRFNPNQVNINLTEAGQLEISISGKWRDTILWEVPLMSIVSEIYFKYMNTDWSMNGQIELAHNKAKKLSEAGCNFTDFGARRRRNFTTQDIVVGVMKEYKGFIGTSNVYLAKKHNVKALGTCAHESIGAVAALESLNHPNKVFMKRWAKTYKGSLGTMLPDTFGLTSFLNNFSLQDAKLWDGVRHDSGNPYIFVDRIIQHYKNLGIDPTTKTIIFSDGLNVENAIELNKYCSGKIRCSFGIGTFFTSDFMKVSDPKSKSKPMNIVIKLTMINEIPVVKISDDEGKSIGDKKMLEIMTYIHVKNYIHEKITL